MTPKESISNTNRHNLAVTLSSILKKTPVTKSRSPLWVWKDVSAPSPTPLLYVRSSGRGSVCLVPGLVADMGLESQALTLSHSLLSSTQQPLPCAVESGYSPCITGTSPHVGTGTGNTEKELQRHEPFCGITAPARTCEAGPHYAENPTPSMPHPSPPNPS